MFRAAAAGPFDEAISEFLANEGDARIGIALMDAILLSPVSLLTASQPRRLTRI